MHLSPPSPVPDSNQYCRVFECDPLFFQSTVKEQEVSGGSIGQDQPPGDPLVDYLQTDLGSAGLARETGGTVFIYRKRMDTIQTSADWFAVFIKSTRRSGSDDLR